MLLHDLYGAMLDKKPADVNAHFSDTEVRTIAGRCFDIAKGCHFK